MVVHVVFVGYGRERFDKTQQGTPCQTEIFQSLHFQDAGLIKRVAQDVVGGLQLLFRERDLLQVIFPIVRVAGQ